MAVARVAAVLPRAKQLNDTNRKQVDQAPTRPSFDLVNSIEIFDGEKTETIDRFFISLEDVGEMSNWTHVELLRVTNLRIYSAALKFVHLEDQDRLATCESFKPSFGDKAPQHCYFHGDSAETW